MDGPGLERRRSGLDLAGKRALLKRKVTPVELEPHAYRSSDSANTSWHRASGRTARGWTI